MLERSTGQELLLMATIDDPVRHYDRITRAWQYLLGEDFHFGYFRDESESLETATGNLTTLMAERGSFGSGMSVLDVGCGIGNPACLLAERYGCRVTGITTSRTGVEHAQLRASERGYSDRVRFIVADGMDNGLPAESFDRVWVLESSHLMPRKDALLTECARVVRPGGRVALCDVMLRRDLPYAEVLSRAGDFIHLNYAFGRAKMESLATYCRFAETAGLHVIESTDISEQTFPTFSHWRLQVETNREQVRALIGDEGLEHFRASCDILPELWKQEILGYGLLVAGKDQSQSLTQSKLQHESLPER
jgi:27-O-demethylrifamycin SV methyltransferase